MSRCLVLCAACGTSAVSTDPAPDLSSPGSAQDGSSAPAPDLAGGESDLSTPAPDLHPPGFGFGDAGACLAKGRSCAMDKDCCSGYCSPTTQACDELPPVTSCSPAGGLCSASTDCCAGTCASDRCSFPPGSSCKIDGYACLSAAECCSAFCDQATFSCAPHPTGPGCFPTGSLCRADSQCCTHHCHSAELACVN